jgi:hypothetical protein
MAVDLGPLGCRHSVCTVAPVDPATHSVGDIVLCEVRGREYLHLVKAIQGPRFSDRQQSRSD